MTALIGVSGEERPGKAPWKPPYYAQSAPYTDAVVAAGGTPVILPLTEDAGGLRRMYDAIDGLLLAGGADISAHLYDAEPHPSAGPYSPLRDATEAAWLRWAMEEGKPVLGICRGMQLVNVVCGGTLYQDIPSELPDALDHRGSDAAQDVAHLAHELRIAEDSQLARVLGVTSIGANARHHQAVRDVAPGYRAVAWSADGVIEAIEPVQPSSYLLAVQAHPETLVPDVEPTWRRLFASFVSAVEAY